MRKLILSAVFVMALGANAQSLERQVIGSTGGSFSGAVQVDWTVGETVIATATAGSVILTQGFQQPPAVPNAVKNINVNSNVTAYPNPSGSLVNVEWKNTAFTGSLALYDATGRMVWNSSLSKISATQIDLSTFAPGVYTLQLLGSDNQTSVLRLTRI